MNHTTQQSDVVKRYFLKETDLHAHVEQRIAERGSLGHLYSIEDTDDGPVASMHGSAAASLWRVVREAVAEAGWKIVRNTDEQ